MSLVEELTEKEIALLKLIDILCREIFELEQKIDDLSWTKILRMMK